MSRKQGVRPQSASGQSKKQGVGLTGVQDSILSEKKSACGVRTGFQQKQL
jgi:hypothetical protein